MASMTNFNPMFVNPKAIQRIDSPVSPLQFKNGDLGVSFRRRIPFFLASEHTSSSENDSDCFTRTSGTSDVDYLPFDIHEYRNILADSLTKASRLPGKLNALQTRISTLSSTIFSNNSLSFYNVCSRIRDLVDGALAQACEFVEVYDAEHDIRRAVGTGPNGIDVQTYMQHVELLEMIVATPRFHSKLFTIVRNLQDSIHVLSEMSLPDSFWVIRLKRIELSLKRISLCFQDASSHDSELLEAAAKHLFRLWHTILEDYSMNTPLPCTNPCLTRSLDRMQPPPPPLSPSLVISLRAIIQYMASKSKEAICIESYVHIRSVKNIESLQILCPEYLDLSNYQDLEVLDWTDLKKHTQSWRQLLEILSIVLVTVEYELCRQIFSSSLPDAVWKTCFVQLAQQMGLERVIYFAECARKVINKYPDKFSVLLDILAALEFVENRLKELLTHEFMSATKINKKLQNVELLLLMEVCKSFPRFCFQTDMEGPQIVPLDGGILQRCMKILESLSKIVNLQSYERILRQEVFVSQNTGEMETSDGYKPIPDIQSLIDVLEHLITNGAATIDRNSKGEAFRALFLMNNYRFIQTSISKNERMSSLVGRENIERFREKAESHARMYVKNAWSGVLHYLRTDQWFRKTAFEFTQDEHGGRLTEEKISEVRSDRVACVSILRSQSFHEGRSSSSSKQVQKFSGSLQLSRAGRSFFNHQKEQFASESQRVRTFKVALTEVCRRHKDWNIPDTDLREAVGKTILELVVPVYKELLSSSIRPASGCVPVNCSLQEMEYCVPVIEKMIYDAFKIQARRTQHP